MIAVINAVKQEMTIDLRFMQQHVNENDHEIVFNIFICEFLTMVLQLEERIINCHVIIQSTR